MTPFDCQALLVMLLTFYPVVGPAALARARDERPEYFSNGEIIGTNRDRFRLPDGRVFDCIFGASGPSDQWRWQCVELTGGAELPPDPFALEVGPVRPIDESAYTFPPFGEVFGPLVRGELDALPGVEATLDRSHLDINEQRERGRAPALDAMLADLDGEIGPSHLALDAAIPDAELGATHEQGGEAGRAPHDYDEELPPEIPGPGSFPDPPSGPDIDRPDSL